MANSHIKSLWYLLAFIIFVGDQSVKTYIDIMTPKGWSYEVTSFFNLVHVLNPGAAFSFLADAGGWQRWFFLVFAICVSIYLVWLIARTVARLEALSYSLILGGALGNAFDRAFRGHVIDYLDFHVRSWHWPAFNVADIAIVTGAITVVCISITGNARQNSSGGNE